MIDTLKRGGLLLAVLGTLGVIGAGCLTRPVETFNPALKENFTTNVTSKTVDKLDILFMIDNSASMGDKQALLALAVPDMINRLVSPNCVDAATGMTTLGPSTAGSCAAFPNSKLEFPPVHDMHLGIVTSSLGSRGGDECPDNTMSMVTGTLAHDNDMGELIARGGVAGDPTMETTVADAANDNNFLAWYPTNPLNPPANAPKVPITQVGAAGQPMTLIGDFAEMIEGVHEHGCGFEAQNEAWYRFLVQPDPFATITVTNDQTATAGIDQTILMQRAAFLRPDSLVAVIVVTDENEEVSNPNAVFRQSWAFENTTFPGSTNPAGTAPEGTTECQQNVDPANLLTTGPNNANCTSCGYKSTQGAGNFASRCPSNGMTGTGGYLDPVNDFPNVRFFHQKFRFGVDAGYPTTRYTRGLTKTTVPSMDHETNGSGIYVGDQAMYANCVNPLFAENLPTDPKQELCKLTVGPRTPDLVFYAAIAGVPHQLLQATPGDMDCPAGTAQADCPQKSQLTDADWLKITGNDPEHYDFTGADFHMVESTTQRVAGWKPDGNTATANTSACPAPTGAPTAAGDTCDPINGREWATSLQDLQFACIFPLVDVTTGQKTTKDCTLAKYAGACDCATGSYTAGTQLCQIGATGYTQTQINGKAYPSVREMVIAHSMGPQGIVSSLCPIHPIAASMTDPLFGYRPAVTAIVNRLKNALNNTCLPQKLAPDATCGNVPCLILAQPIGGTPGMAGTCANPGSLCDSTKGLIAPQPDDTMPTPQYKQSVATNYCNALHDAWVATGDTNMNDDPDLRPVCAINQLVNAGNASCSIAPTPGAFTAGSCATSSTPGWCYVTGAAANGCPQAILFTPSEPPQGWSANLQCIEVATSIVGDGGGD
jgi:hypothetical protein